MFGDKFQREPRTGVLLCHYVTCPMCIAVPDERPEGGSALLVVTDAALHFDATLAAARALANRPTKTGVAPTIVLGVASGPDWSHDAERRKRALLPDGADNAALHAALREAIADLAAIAPINPNRSAIMGHSFGGLFALDALARAPDLFSACVAFSPSLWTAPGLAERVAHTISGRDARILLASGELEPQINADLPAAAEILGAAAQVTRATLPGEDHGSLPFAALPMALRFLHGTVR